MGAGRFALELERDRELESELEARDYQHIQFWWGNELIAQGPILHPEIDRDLYVVVGALMPWWLGVESEGTPEVVAFRRYCASTNKLSNPDFDDGDLYWRTPEDSKWRFLTGPVRARTIGDFDGDDVLASAEEFEVFTGDTMGIRADARFNGDEDGALRLRAVFSGRFRHPSLVSDDDAQFAEPDNWTGAASGAVLSVDDPANARPGHTRVLKIGPQAKAQMLVNGGFEDGIDGGGWTHDDAWHNSTALPEYAEGVRGVRLDGDEAPAGNDLIQTISNMTDDTHYRFGMSVNPSALPNKAIRARLLYDEDGDNNGIQELELILMEDFGAEGWRRREPEFNLPTLKVGNSDVDLVIDAPGLSSGDWHVDRVSIRRLENNIERTTHVPWIPVVPGRTYRVRGYIRAEEGVSNGEVWWRVRARRFEADDSDEESFESRKFSGNDNRWHRLEIDVTPESGFSFINLQLVAKDVYGGSMWLGDVSVIDTDDRSLVAERRILTTEADDTTFLTFTHTLTVPTGADTMHLDLVAEQDGGGWDVEHARVRWIDTPVAAESIVADVVQGTGLSLGTVHAAGNIAFDWIIRNLTNRQILDAISGSGFVQPAREWSIDPDGRLHWGLPDEIFADRSTFILDERDVFLGEDPSSDMSVDDRVGKVRVVGGERQTPRGERIVVTGQATLAVNSALFDGSPFARERLLEDGSVDTAAYANALAAQLITQAANKRRSHTFDLRDWRALGDATGKGFGFDVGDWIRLHVPAVGIEDPDGGVPYNGRTIYPERVRARARTLRLGSGPFAVKLRRGPGDVVDITSFVRFEAETTASIEVGDPYPSFALDPQGGGAGRQYLKFRAATRAS